LEHKKRPATPINLGNPKEITLLDLANRIKVLTNSKSPLEFKALPEDDPRQRKPDISKANELLAWYPTTDLQDGLKKTINYFKEHLS
jgi:nucleoside-diphosphate-sugar epimerase